MSECGGKKTYKSKHEAQGAKAWVGEMRGKDMRIYQCDKCFGWHLTKHLKRLDFKGE